MNHFSNGYSRETATTGNSLICKAQYPVLSYLGRFLVRVSSPLLGCKPQKLERELLQWFLKESYFWIRVITEKSTCTHLTIIIIANPQLMFMPMCLMIRHDHLSGYPMYWAGALGSYSQGSEDPFLPQLVGWLWRNSVKTILHSPPQETNSWTTTLFYPFSPIIHWIPWKSKIYNFIISKT